jgi:HlyD family secretion protein
VDAYPNENFSARLISVRFAPKTVENVVTYQTVLAVDNANYLLRPGMTATATIVIERRSNVMMVPYAALRFMPELYRGEDQVKTTPRRSPPGLMGMMMPRMKKQSQSQGNVLRSGASRIIWVLKNEELESKEVVLGLLDGQKAEIISTNIRVGDQVVINSRLPR